MATKCHAQATEGQQKDGFTLVELLVVAALLCFLGCAVAPALSRTRPNGQAFQCQNNLRQMAVAWSLYAADSGGILVSNHFGAPTGSNGSSGDWVSGWLDWTTSVDITNRALLTDSRFGKLALYLSRSAGPFKCPSDRFQSPIQRSLGWPPRVRSISMNAAVGPGSGKVEYLPNLVLATKLSDFVRPGPAEVWVFGDEQADSINDVCLINDPSLAPGAYRWLDLPAGYHNGCGSFSFADGHAGTKRWTDPRTLAPVRASDFIPFACPNSADYRWLMEHMPKQTH